MSLSTKYNEIQAHMNTLTTHLAELETKSKKASAPKARASAQIAKNLLMELRKDITTHVKSIPVKSRNVKKEIVSPATLTEAEPPRGSVALKGRPVAPTHSAVEAEEEVKKEQQKKEPQKTEEKAPKQAPKPKRPRVVKKKVLPE